MCITAFIRARHLSLSWANSIQSITPHHTSRISILILSFHLRLGFPSDVFPFVFPTKTLYRPHFSPLRATCPAHRILLDFITRTILCEEYGSLSFSLCSFLHCPVASSLLGSNIHLSTLFSKQFRDTRHYYAPSNPNFTTRLQYFPPVYNSFHRVFPVCHPMLSEINIWTATLKE